MIIKKGIQLHVIQTKKFKDIAISIRFANALDRQKAPARSLLALMLCDRCLAYPSKQEMSSYQDSLYGATLHAQTMGYGNSQVMEIRMKTINPEYVLDGKELMKDIFTFLNEILYRPALTQELFEEAKMMLLARIQRNEDDPSQYAISQGLKLAGEGTPLSISTLGEKDGVNALTLEDIKQCYQDMLAQDVIDILLCGDVCEDDMISYVKQFLPFDKRDTQLHTYYQVGNDLHEEYRESYKNISQTSIMMVWFSKTTIVDHDYYALRVANAIFGQYSTSLLFQEVREKNSLCYSIFSNLIAYDGALGVTTGVEKEKIEQTISLIRTQFNRLINGQFDEELLNVSKQMIINSLKASKDNMNSLIALQYQNDLLKKEDTTDDIIQKIERVTCKDVIEVSKKCELKMTFVVTQGGDAHA